MKNSHANPMKRSGSESSQYGTPRVDRGFHCDKSLAKESKTSIIRKKTGRCVWVMVLGPNHLFDCQVAGHFAMESIVTCGHSSWPSELNYLIWGSGRPDRST